MGAKKIRAVVNDLTQREWEVFDLIVSEGLNNTEIAERLGITERSAKFHTSNVLRKTGTPDRLKLTVMFWRDCAGIKKAPKPAKAPRAARASAPRATKAKTKTKPKSKAASARAAR